MRRKEDELLVRRAGGTGVRENAKKKLYIVRVPVRGIMSMTFDSWEKARKEVDRIQSDYPTQVASIATRFN